MTNDQVQKDLELVLGVAQRFALLPAVERADQTEICEAAARLRSVKLVAVEEGMKPLMVPIFWSVVHDLRAGHEKTCAAPCGSSFLSLVRAIEDGTVDENGKVK